MKTKPAIGCAVKLVAGWILDSEKNSTELNRLYVAHLFCFLMCYVFILQKYFYKIMAFLVFNSSTYLYLNMCIILVAVILFYCSV